ncbi:Response regulator ArlR [Thiorhodovibrio winogradskyi]|uniref:Response regulator ArlR n=1 Tax=Thiorhodovibrio winogradskyi TaxID=77007 RepID=A0ABZ0SBL8_9GAMM|nr:response regulator [Thiorhodovibrio winogradskyi]
MTKATAPNSAETAKAAAKAPATATRQNSPHVLIVEDDTSTRLLLESLIRRLWNDSRIESFGEVQSALDAWRLHGADLALVDIDLPGVGGLALLEQIAREPSRATTSVIISHHKDRAIVLQAMKYRARDYIVKPFTARDLMQRLSDLMQFAPSKQLAAAGGEQHRREALERLLRDAIGFRRLSLPIDPELVEKMEAWHLQGELDKARILEHWVLEPALVARLLGAANSGPYNTSGQAVSHFAQALDQLDPGTICNLAIALALQPGSTLAAPELRDLAEDIRARQRGIYRQVVALGASVRTELALYATACALHRIGVLAVLQLIQAWMEQGGQLSAEELTELVKRYGPEADDAIKTLWLIPQQLRDLSRAPDEKPRGAPSQPLMLMRIAGLRFSDEPTGEHSEELRRLCERAGLPPPRVA